MCHNRRQLKVSLSSIYIYVYRTDLRNARNTPVFNTPVEQTSGIYLHKKESRTLIYILKQILLLTINMKFIYLYYNN